MKHLLLTTIAALVLVGCGESQQSAPAPAPKPEPPTAKAPAISIHQAAKDGNIEAVKQHLDAGTDVNTIDLNGMTPIDLADGEIADLLRKHGGKTGEELSIHIAAMNGNIEAVKQHLAAGTDVNAKLSHGQGGITPLIVAAGGGHKEIAELLIANGADVNATDDGGKTPLDWAFGYLKLETIDLLRKHGGKSGVEDSIIAAASLGNVNAVKKHLAAGTDVNTKDDRGRTPLHWAAYDGRNKIAELLITAGADVNANSDNGTPLDTAISRKHPETAAPPPQSTAARRVKN